MLKPKFNLSILIPRIDFHSRAPPVKITPGLFYLGPLCFWMGLNFFMFSHVFRSATALEVWTYFLFSLFPWNHLASFLSVYWQAVICFSSTSSKTHNTFTKTMRADCIVWIWARIQCVPSLNSTWLPKTQPCLRIQTDRLIDVFTVLERTLFSWACAGEKCLDATNFKWIL